jgi:ribosome-associated toxin RatA of RatAB toxin-antitoxin module
MRTVHVTRTIPAPPEAVFDLLADHANYDRFRGIRRSELLREGDPAPNGVGAMRRVRIGPLRFEEEITAFERSSRFEYLIMKVNTPFEHLGGRIEVSGSDGGSLVDWTSSFRIPVPAIGGLIERPWSFALARGFRRVLEDVERMTA